MGVKATTVSDSFRFCVRKKEEKTIMVRYQNFEAERVEFVNSSV